MGIQKATIQEIETLLKGLGVSRGQTVMLHSAILTLGRIENGMEGLYSAIQNLIGEEGTLIVPTFTWSFRRNELFDVLHSKTPPVIGSFSEHIRLKPNANRSLDPLFSMSAIGPKAEFLMNRENLNSFGKGSIYDKIFHDQALIVALGITYSTGISAFMHLERLASVPYRMEKSFEGITRGYDGIERPDSCVHFVRNEKNYPTGRTNREPMGLLLENAGVSKALTYGSGRHVAMPSKLFQEFVLEKLAKNPKFMFVQD